MTVLPEELDEIHHPHDFVLREFSVERERVGRPVFVCYLDLDFLPQAGRMRLSAS